MRVRLSVLLCLFGLPAFAQVATAPVIPPAPPAAPAPPQSVSELESRLSTVESDLARRANVLYRLQRAGMLPVAGGFDSMLAHLGRIQRLERMLADGVAARADLRASLERQRAVEVERAAEQARQAEIAAAQPPDHGLNSFFDPNYTPRLPVAPVPQQGMRLRDRPARTFQQLRGRLPMPVQGSSMINDASREDGQGLEFSAASSDVRAVAAGTVAFARPYGRYGSMVVVDHGQSFFTVYGGLGAVNVRVGQSVFGEQSIGRSGETLYFEVRRGSRSLDPRSWFGL